MEQKTITIPFDLETAKKIKEGEILGQIVTEKGCRAEIVYEDISCKAYPLLVVIHSASVMSNWFSVTGETFNSTSRLLLEVPEYTTFKASKILKQKNT